MKNKKGRLLINLGLLLIAAALFLTVYNFNEERNAEKSVLEVMSRLEEALPADAPEEKSGKEPVDESEKGILEIEYPDAVLNPDMEMPVKKVDGQDYIGILEIPALELKLPVISDWSYSQLKIAPCRYSGSAYRNDLVIAAHNYQSHFGTLKNLSDGDRLIFTDMDGNVFQYEVVLLETLEPTAVDEMKSGEWDLTLFTCTVGGSYRVTVRCERLHEESK